MKAASGRIGALALGRRSGLFLGLCAAFGFAYQYGRDLRWFAGAVHRLLAAPFLV